MEVVAVAAAAESPVVEGTVGIEERSERKEEEEGPVVAVGTAALKTAPEKKLEGGAGKDDLNPTLKDWEWMERLGAWEEEGFEAIKVVKEEV